MDKQDYITIGGAREHPTKTYFDSGFTSTERQTFHAIEERLAGQVT